MTLIVKSFIRKIQYKSIQIITDYIENLGNNKTCAFVFLTERLVMVDRLQLNLRT